ncbi:MAG: hypothetical protein LBI02_10470 [Opitutaceae bacterium]|jgi:predicted AAA+ superfamily ATPase|nr:hypothetical protein [Opitutaceae bacterium]
MIPRQILPVLKRQLKQFPIVALTGPRQSGKTTLARLAAGRRPYVSLEDPDRREHALGDPRGFLAQFPDGVVHARGTALPWNGLAPLLKTLA